jgi:hypothetical protein
MADAETTVYTVTITLRVCDLELASALARDAFEYAAAEGRHNPGLDWEMSKDRYTESRLPPIRLHDGDIDAIAERVRGERREPAELGQWTPGELAQAAYAAYGTSTGGKNYQGLPMPAWADLPEPIRDAWAAAAGAAVRADHEGVDTWIGKRD